MLALFHGLRPSLLYNTSTLHWGQLSLVGVEFEFGCAAELHNSEEEE